MPAHVVRLAVGLWLVLAASLASAQPRPPAPSAAPNEAADSAASLVATSRSSVPANNSDLRAVKAQADQILALAGQCNSARCPVVESCATAASLLQALNDAQVYLEAMETALNKASANAAQAHNNVIAQTRITSTNLEIAQEALAVQEYLYKIATILFDIASLSDDLKTMAEKGTLAPGENWAQKLDGAYESMKDLEAVVNDTIGTANDLSPGAPPTTGGTPLSGATAGALGISDEKMSQLNDLKSSLSDAANAINELRKQYKENGGRMSNDMLGGLSKAAGKVVFRALKVEVERQMAALKQLIAELEANLSAEERILAGLFRERMRMNERRDAATDARRAVAAARNALIACMARACGLPSLTRPSLPDYYAPPAGLSARDLGRHFGWGNALRDLAPRLAGVESTLRARFVVKDICVVEGGGGGVIDGGGGGIPIGPRDGGLVPTERATTQCLPCRSIADSINRILDEVAFIRAEIARIERNLERGRQLRVELGNKERSLRVHEKYLQELRDIVRNAVALGVNVGGEARQELTLAEAKRVEMVGELAALRRDIEQAEAERGLLAPYKARIGPLHDARRTLRRQLAYCEEDKCRKGYLSELDTWINLAGNNPLNPIDPLGPTITDPVAAGDKPVLTLTVTRNTGEGDAPGEFLITLSRPAPPGGLLVNYQFSGTATAGADYLAVFSGTLVAGGASSAIVTVTPVEDTLVEGTETIQLTLSPGAAYALGAPSSAVMTIADNDGAPQVPGTLQFSASTYSTSEGAGAVTITVTRTGGTSGAVSVNYATASSSATAGADYTSVNATLNWPPGDGAAKTFTVPIIDDTLVEGPETFFVILNGAGGGATIGAIAQATVTIADNDTAPTGPCGTSGHAWQGNVGSYSCSGSCSPTPSPQALSINGDLLTLNPFHAGGAATFQGCSQTLNSQSSTLTYFSQSNHRATITRTSNTQFNANIVSSGGGTCFFSCSR